MEKMSIREVATAVGAYSAAPGFVTSVCTDTRALEEGCLFVALKGERFNGNAFALQAAAQGAAALLCEAAPAGADIPVIVVEDTGDALLKLAGYYRAQFDFPVVGVTGSVGKTTTKEMTAAVLSQQYNTLKTEGNFNNQIGLPKMLFRLQKETEAAVLEMGMDHAGQIERLSRAAAPTLSIITNIGVSHIEHFGSQEGILQAKLEILKGMSPEAPVILNGDDRLLRAAAGETHNPVLLVGIDTPGCDLQAEHIVQKEDGISFAVSVQALGISVPIWLPVIGRHHVYDALFAFAAGSLLQIPFDRIARGLASYAPVGMRQRVVRAGGITVIEDCYNASPDSVKASLAALAAMPCEGRRVAVLGDMLELGDYAAAAHAECGEAAAKAGLDLLLAYGENARGYVRAAAGKGLRAEHFTEKQALAQRLNEWLRPGDIALFKASRGMRLEEALEPIYAVWKPGRGA